MPSLNSAGVGPAQVQHHVQAINALVTKLERAEEKIEQYQRSIGQHIKAVKAARPDDWEDIVKAECDLGRSRAYELMAIADGTKTVAEVRAATNKRAKASQAKTRRLARPLISGQPAPTESAEDDESFLDDEGGYAAVDYKTASISTRTRGFIWRAEQSALAARRDHLEGIPITREMKVAAAEAATAWAATEAKVVSAETQPADDREPDEFDHFVSKLVGIDRGLAVELHDLLRSRHRRDVAFELEFALKMALEPGDDTVGSTEPLNGDDPGPIPECLRRKPEATTDSVGKGASEGVTLGDAVADAFSELEDLACDCRQVVDNAPEGLNQAPRIQTLDETANVLEGLSAPDVSAELAEVKVTPPKHRKPRSRGDRRDAALGIITACIDALDAIDESDPHHQEARDLRAELEDASSQSEMCEFPGMYQ